MWYFGKNTFKKLFMTWCFRADTAFSKIIKYHKQGF